MSYETQNNFSAGELSPLLYYRNDVAARQAGSKEMLNMIAIPHGPAMARFGFRYIDQIPDDYARMFSFDFIDYSIPVIIGTSNIYIFDVDGAIVETIPSPYSELAIRELQSAMQPRNELDGHFLLHLFVRETAPRHILFDGINFTLEISVFLGEDWTDHPGCVTFHDGRMYVAGSNNEPVTIWASVPNDFFDFTLGVGDSANDALIFPLAKAGVIRWVESNDVLFVGLSTGEQIIFSQGGPITPDNANTDQQSKFGSKRVQALIAENLVVYVNTNGRVVRGMTFSDVNEKYNSEELSFQAEHITEGGISELHYAESMPNMNSMSILFCVLENGNISVMSLNTSQGVAGWHRHYIGDETISIVTVNEDGIDYPWVLVKRNGVIYCEKYGDKFLDSYINIDLGVPGIDVVGLDHLADREVSIIADGRVHPIKTVNADGTLTLDFDAQFLSIGLGYNKKVVTLPQLDDTEEGSTLTFVKRFSKVFVAIIDSARPIVNGEDTFLRQPETSMGTREEFTTEIIEVSNDGWSNDSEITIEQPLPLPLLLAATGGKLKANKV